jgi:hypothetical protein
MTGAEGKLPKCTGCGLMLCFMCRAHVDAPDQGLKVVCEECAKDICTNNDMDAVAPGGVIHLEAYYMLEGDDIEEEFDEKTNPEILFDASDTEN